MEAVSCSYSFQITNYLKIVTSSMSAFRS